MIRKPGRRRPAPAKGSTEADDGVAVGNRLNPGFAGFQEGVVGQQLVAFRGGGGLDALHRELAAGRDLGGPAVDARQRSLRIDRVCLLRASAEEDDRRGVVGSPRDDPVDDVHCVQLAIHDRERGRICRLKVAPLGVDQVLAHRLRHACLRIRLPNGALHRWQFEKDGQPVQIDVDGPITLDEASLTRIAVLDGMGIAYAMESDVREDIDARRLVRVLEDWTPSLSPVCLYYANRRNSSAAFRAFIEMARSLAA